MAIRNAEFDTRIGSQKYTCEFNVDAEKLTGTATGPQGSVAIEEYQEFATGELVAKRVK